MLFIPAIIIKLDQVMESYDLGKPSILYNGTASGLSVTPVDR